MYHLKCHKAIKDNATNQNCKKLLKLIKKAEQLDLVFVFAYNRHFPASLSEPEKNIKYIEIIDKILYKNFGINATIIKSESCCTVLFDRLPDFIKLDKKQFKLYSSRIEAIKEIFELVQKFNLDELPIL